jgi:hypothetical protein
MSVGVSAHTGEGVQALRHIIDAAAQLAACRGGAQDTRQR